VNPGNTRFLNVLCADDEEVVSGGHRVNFDRGVTVTGSAPLIGSGLGVDAWHVDMHNGNSFPVELEAFALCLPASA
jgi:hypothetical protein